MDDKINSDLHDVAPTGDFIGLGVKQPSIADILDSSDKLIQQCSRSNEEYKNYFSNLKRECSREIVARGTENALNTDREPKKLKIKTNSLGQGL